MYSALQVQAFPLVSAGAGLLLVGGGLVLLDLPF